ncbi:SusC/RagA family TonB-linked outer membrane protein [Mangrovibacterium sp.]|uniref:SusC/RagA family TonB-linked outer membrane protein n=1 Tax=Mangrovibacterium sp. TaxID=1961364 RepID=UPI0035667889
MNNIRFYIMVKYIISVVAIVLLTSFSIGTYAQEQSGKVVKGTVVSATTKQGLAGINISLKRFSSAITDENGKFSIKIHDDRATLVVSSPGFQTKEVAIKGRTELEIQLFEEDFDSYYGDVLMPLGWKSKTSTVNSVVSIGQISNDTYETLEEKFSGEVPGLRAILRSGTPASGANMFIRGYSSLNGSTEPLVVVDGMILESGTYSASLSGGHQFSALSAIDPKDIASISVIKDAVSIYGSKAANGVILIETNRSKDISTKIDFHIQGGMNLQPENIPMMNASQYKSYLVDQIGSSGLYTDAEVAQLPFLNESPSFTDYTTYHNETNWQDEVFRDSYSKNYYLRITGGDDVAKYGLSVGYMANEGVISSTDFNRLTTRFNADSKITSKLSFSGNLSVNYQDNEMRDEGLNEQSAPMYVALLKAPILTPYVADDSGVLTTNYAGVDAISGYSNPKALIDNVTNENRNYSIFSNFKFTYEFNPQWKLSTLVGVNYTKNNDKLFLPSTGISAGVTVNEDVVYRTSGIKVEWLYSIYNDTRLSFAQTFNQKHNLLFNAGVRYNVNNYENSWSTSGNSGDDEFTSLGSGDRLTAITSGEIGNWKWASMYANADYGFLNKYFVSLNVAFDGSSRFGEDAKDGINLGATNFGVFPAIGAAWLVSSEDFMADNNWIDQLKLRASHGITGNDGIGNYTAESYFIAKRFLEGTGLVSGNLANTGIQWERTTKTNLGLDFGLFNERLAVTLDVFNHVTDRLLSEKEVSPVYGYYSYLNNDGKLRNRGIELGMNARLINKESFKWDLGFNIATYKNEIIALPDQKNLVELSGVGATILNQEGSALGLFYGYKTDGIFQSQAEADAAALGWIDPLGFEQAFVAGDVKFVNTNSSDNIINADDRVVIGDPNPDFVGMFSNHFQYRRFALDAVFTFSSGNDIYNALRAKTESMSNFANQSLVATRRWKADNHDTDVPRAEYGDPAGNSRFSDRWIEDGSYIRLKTLSLTYSPKFKVGFVRNAAITLTANNLFTLTKYVGYDPEVSMSGTAYAQGIDAGLTPQFTSVFVGLRLGL